MEKLFWDQEARAHVAKVGNELIASAIYRDVNTRRE
jgi:hypothetical protein